MPPPPRPARRRSGRAVVVSSVLAVAVSAALIWTVVRFASQNPEEAGLGDPVFRVGRAERLSRDIAEDGPFLFPDPLSRGRNLYVQHLGDDPDAGWVGVEARLPDDPACPVQWDAEGGWFVDCRDGTHPPDGAGLTTYDGTVEDGKVSFDLRTPAGSSS